MATYIVAEYCSGCDVYSKRIGRGSLGDCEICSEQMECKTVEKWGEHDPNVQTEVVNICYGENPRYSATLGVTENQIEQARKLHPEADWKKFGHSYRPLIKNRADKLRMMKQAGYEEYDLHQHKGRTE